jgi:hypothetical protein
MVQTKHMNENSFAKILKEFSVAGELVRARQDEKQGLLDEFDEECKRFFFGKISRRALQSSVKKTNKELMRLDREIRQNIAKAKAAGNRAVTLTGDQMPIGFRATLSGIVGGKAKAKKTKRKSTKRKSSKKKSTAKRRTPKKKRR